jgi:predicted enzyme related to lactoylglutathione lyase
MGCVLREIAIDCADPKRVAEFWSQVLDWPLKQEPDGICWLTSNGEPSGPPPVLVFAKVPEPKTVKNRVHIDVNPSGADQAQELERLLALGARRIDIGQGDVPWVVLADVEGNEFCLLARRVDAEG